jgi:hypothetical protein
VYGLGHLTPPPQENVITNTYTNDRGMVVPHLPLTTLTIPTLSNHSVTPQGYVEENVVVNTYTNDRGTAVPGLPLLVGVLVLVLGATVVVVQQTS